MADMKPQFNKSKLKKVNIPRNAVGAWLTNVGKSVGYSAQDVIDEVLPATSAHIASGAELIQSFRDKMMQFRVSDMRKQIEESEYADIARSGVKNAIDALKTGKFYDKEKAAAAIEDDLDFGFDDDFDLGGDDDFSVDSDIDISDGEGSDVIDSVDSDGEPTRTTINVKMDIGENSPVVGSITNQTEVVSETINYQTEVTKSNHAMVMNEFSSFSKDLQSTMSAMADNVAQIASTLTPSITQHTSISAKYYSDSMEIFGKIHETLNNIYTLQKPVEQDEKKRPDDVLDLFGSGGELHLGDYVTLVKKQFGDAVASDLFLSQIASILEDKDALKYLAQNPLKFVSSGIVNTFFTPAIKEAMTAVDQTLKGFTTTLLHGIASYGDLGQENPVVGFLANTFGIDNKLSTSIDRSKYVRGKIDWDGESKKTLVEVIPFYLRKIASALTGDREYVFDYEKGMFSTLSDVKASIKQSLEQEKLGGMSDIYASFAKMATSTVQFRSKAEQDSMLETARKFFVGLSGGKGNRLFQSRRDGSFANAVSKLTEQPEQSPQVRLLAGFLDGLDPATLMGISNSILESKYNISNRYADYQQSPTLNNHMMYEGNGMPDFDKFYRKENGESVELDLVKRGIAKGELDKYGRSSQSYLRDILKVLVNGIGVYNINPHTGVPIAPNATAPASAPTTPGQGTILIPGRGGNPIAINALNAGNTTGGARVYSPSSSIAAVGRELATEKEQYDQARIREANAKEGAYSDEKIEEGTEKKGKLLFDADPEAQDGPTAISLDAVKLATKNFLEEEKSKEERENKQTNVVMDALLKYTSLNEDSPLIKMINGGLTFANQKPYELISKATSKLDNFMFKLIFGPDSRKKEQSLLDAAFESLKGYFGKFAVHLNGMLEKLNDALFNDENGLITQIKNSQIGQAISNQFSGIREYLFGKSSTDESGNTTFTGGLFSNTANEIIEIGADAQAKVAEVTNEMGEQVKVRTNKVLDRLFGNSGVDPRSGTFIKDTLDRVTNRLDSAISDFVDKYVDDEDERVKIFNEIKNDLHGKDSKVAASSLFGILAGAFSGAGIVGGGIVGLAKGILDNSETAQKVFFGDLREDGSRSGGVVSGELIDIYEKNKTGAGVGFAAGTIANMGLLPAFFGPAGPIVGAILGMGTSMAYHSETFQDMLFGPADANGNRTGGMFSQVQDSFNKIHDAMFAKADENGEGGGFVTNAFKTFNDNIKNFATMTQDEFMNWFEKDIVIPMESAMAPFADEFRRVGEFLLYSVTSVGEAVTNRVVEPMAESINDTFIEPVKGMSEFLYRSFTGALGAAISSPVKLLEATAGVLEEKHKFEGQLDYLNSTGFAGSLNASKMFGAKYSDEGAWYRLKGIPAARKKEESDLWLAYKKRMRRGEVDKISRAEFREYNNFADFNDEKTKTRVAEERAKRAKGASNNETPTVANTEPELTVTQWLTEELNIDDSGDLGTTINNGEQLAALIAEKMVKAYEGIGALNQYKLEDLTAALKEANIQEDVVDQFAANYKNMGEIVKALEKERDKNEGKPASTTTQATQESEVPTIDNSTPEGKAFGGKINKLGAYVLSPGEIVVPNMDPAQRKQDDAREKAYIRSNFGNSIKGFASGAGIDETNAQGFFAGLVSGFKEASSTKSKEEKEQEEVAKRANLANRQLKGSFEERTKQALLDKRYREQTTLLEKISAAVEATAAVSTSYVTDWGALWNRKKGVLTLAMLGFSPMILKIIASITSLISDASDFYGVIQVTAENISRGIENIGGSITGVLNNIKNFFTDTINSIKEFFDPTSGKSFVERLANFITPYNEETGEYEVDAYTNAKAKALRGIGYMTVGNLVKREELTDKAGKVIKGAYTDPAIKGIAKKASTAAGFANHMVINKALGMETFVKGAGATGVIGLNKKVIDLSLKAMRGTVNATAEIVSKSAGKEIATASRSSIGVIKDIMTTSIGQYFKTSTDLLKKTAKLTILEPIKAAKNILTYELKGISEAAKLAWKVPSAVGSKVGGVAGKVVGRDAEKIAANKVFGVATEAQLNRAATYDELGKLGQKAGKVAQTAVSMPGKVAGDLAKDTSMIAKDWVAKPIQETMGKAGTKVGTKVGKAAGAVTEFSTTIANDAKVFGDDIISKVTKIITTVASKIADVLGIGSSKVMGAITGVFKTVGGLDKFLRDNSAKIRDSLADKLRAGAKSAGRAGHKTTGKALRNAGRFVGRLGTAGLFDIGMAAFGLVDGAASAANLFQVSDEYVTAPMRAISSVFKALLNTLPGTVIDIINLIFSEITGVSFIQNMAIAIYSLVSSTDDLGKLNKGLEEFDNKYDAAVKEQYEAFLQTEEGKQALESGQYSGDWKTDEATFRSSGKAMSKNEFNNKENMTLGSKIALKATNLMTKVSETAKKPAFYSKAYWDVSQYETPEEQTKAYLDRLVNLPFVMISQTIEGAKHVVDDAFTSVKALGKGAVVGFTQTFTKVKSVKDVFSEAYWASPHTEGKTDIASSAATISQSLVKLINIPTALVYGLGQDAVRGLKSIVNKAAVFSASMSRLTDTNLSSISGLSDVFSDSYWAAPATGEDGNPLSAISTLGFYGMRLLQFIPSVVIGAGKDLARQFNGPISKVKTFIVQNTGIDLDSDIFPKDEEGNPLSPFQMLMFAGAKLVQWPIKAFTGAAKLIAPIATGIAETIGPAVGWIAEDLVQALKAVDNPLDIFTSKYWDHSNVTEDGYGFFSIRNLLFIGSRLALAVPMATLGMAKQAFGAVKDIVGGGMETFTNMFDIPALSKLKTSEFFSLSSYKEDGTFTNMMSRMVFTLSRLIMYIPSRIYWLVNSVMESPFMQKAMDGAKAFGGGVKNLGEWLMNWFNGGDEDGETTGTTGSSRSGGISYSSVNGGEGGRGESVNGFPYYSQNDPKYKNAQFKYSYTPGTNPKDETMGSRGCGPTAMAMISDSFAGRGDTPLAMAKYATDEGYSTKAGTTTGYFKSMGTKLGLNVTEAQASPDVINTMISQGKPMIIQGKSDNPNSPYTSAGHYVVAVGRDANGNILINDPRGKKYSHAYSMDDIMNGSYRVWGFDKGTGGYGASKVIGRDGNVIYGNFGGRGIAEDAATISENISNIAGGNQVPEAQAVIEVASKYIGYLEKASNSKLDDMEANPGDGNFTIFSKKYGSIMKCKVQGQAWCAIFVSMVLVEALGESRAKELLGGKLYSYIPNMMAYFKSINAFHHSKPQPGDFFIYKASARSSGQRHVGIVVDVQGNRVTTIEGNSTGPNGQQGVWKHEGIDISLAEGFCRPKYSGTVRSKVASSSSKSDSPTKSFSDLASKIVAVYSDAANEFIFGKSAEASEDSSSEVTKVDGTSNAAKMYNYLTGTAGYSQDAALGILGNIAAESGINPINLENSKEKAIGMNDQQYTEAVDSGKYSRNRFMQDYSGYGLAQWTYWSRKRDMYDHLKNNGLSIGDLEGQTEFLAQELEKSGAPAKINNLSRDDATEWILKNYEKPADTSRAAVNKRIKLTDQVAEDLGIGGRGESPEHAIPARYVKEARDYSNYALVQPPSEPVNYRKVPSSSKMAETADNFIAGKGSSDTLNDEQVIALLQQIVNELHGTNQGINKFNDKEFKVTTKPTVIVDGSDKSVNVTNNNQQPKQQKSPKRNEDFLASENYRLAKKIAAGDVVW